MAVLKIYWNFVDTVHDADLRMIAKDTAVTNNPTVVEGCRGVYIRSVVSEEADFSDLLSQLQFSQVRQSRNVPSESYLFVPKCPGEMSIGVLRIIKPRQSVSGQGALTQPLPNINSTGAGLGNQFDVLLETSQFIVEDIQEQMAEKFQLQETFGDFNVFFFGRRAEIFTYSGSLLNGEGNRQWRNQFMDNYEKFLRGTKCAEQKARAYFLYDDQMREGYILSAGISQHSTVDGVVKFTFTMLITNKKIMGFIPDSMSGTLTLDQTGKPSQGITEYQYFRASDPDLPGVIEAGGFVDIDESAASTQATQFSPGMWFVENKALPGDNPPDDLTQILLKRSLDAYNEVKDAIATSDFQSVDHDVLLDFVPANQLGSNTRLIISGARSLDVNNLSGDQLVLALIGNSRTPDSLTLAQLRSVADSLAKGTVAKIDPSISQVLTKESQFFAANSEFRLTNTPLDAKTTKLSDILSASKYILASSVDNQPVSTLVSTLSPISSFDEPTTTKSVSGLAPISVLDQISSAFQGFAGLRFVEAYMASFLLIKDPNTGSLFNSVQSAFGVPAGGISQSNSLDALKSFSLNQFRTASTTVPTEVMSRVSPLLDFIKTTALAQHVSLEITVLVEDIGLNDVFLNANATVAGTPQITVPAGTFLTLLGTYLVGLCDQLSLYDGGLPPTQATITSTDIPGNKVRNFAGNDNLKPYFDTSFATIAGSSTLDGPSQAAAKQVLMGQTADHSVPLFKRLPDPRNYLGGANFTLYICSATNIGNAMQGMSALVQNAVGPMLDQAATRISAVFAGESSEENLVTALRTSLKLSILTPTLPILSTIAASLQTLGITVDNYFDLVEAIQIEQAMAKHITGGANGQGLLDLVKQAIADAQANPNCQSVAQNDSQVGSTLCG